MEEIIFNTGESDERAKYFKFEIPETAVNDLERYFNKNPELVTKLKTNYSSTDNNSEFAKLFLESKVKTFRKVAPGINSWTISLQNKKTLGPHLKLGNIDIFTSEDSEFRRVLNEMVAEGRREQNFSAGEVSEAISNKLLSLKKTNEDENHIPITLVPDVTNLSFNRWYVKEDAALARKLFIGGGYRKTRKRRKSKKRRISKKRKVRKSRKSKRRKRRRKSKKR